MLLAPLTFRSIRARAVVLKLKRPVVARIARINDWPLILIDLFTEEGVVGRSYLEPYTIKTMRYLVPALQDFGAILKGRRVAPVELYDLARKSLHFVGYQGLSMIAVSGLDMAAWSWWHWVVFNLPPGTTSLPKGAGDAKKKLTPKGAVQSRTDFGADGYGWSLPAGRRQAPSLPNHGICC
jgi:hypothetical protein